MFGPASEQLFEFLMETKKKTRPKRAALFHYGTIVWLGVVRASGQRRRENNLQVS